MKRILIEEFGVSIACERDSFGNLVIDVKSAEHNPTVQYNGYPLAARIGGPRAGVLTLAGGGSHPNPPLGGGASMSTARMTYGNEGPMGGGSTTIVWDGKAGAGGGVAGGLAWGIGGCSTAADSPVGGCGSASQPGPTFNVPHGVTHVMTIDNGELTAIPVSLKTDEWPDSKPALGIKDDE